MKYNVASLFAGIGGICLGIKTSSDNSDSFELVWSNEIDEHACVTYRTNFEHVMLDGDINFLLNPDESDNKEYFLKLREKATERKIDVLNGGFPCQAFSIAGNQLGFQDARGNLFWSIINTVKLIESKFEKPRVLFLENVKNLKSHDKGRTYQVIKGEIEKLGYIVKEAVLNTMFFSELPQNRERIYIICFRDKQDADKFTMFDHLNEFKMKFTKEQRIQQIKNIIDYDKEIPEKYYYTKEKYPHYFITKEEYEKLPKDEQNETRINLDEEITEMYQFYQIRRGMYIRKNQSNVCPTLTANMGTGGHNVPLIKDKKGIRKLTPTETLRLQGFPVGSGYKIPKSYNGRIYPDSYLYKQAGNAVSVPVIRLISKEILKVFKENDSKK